VGRLAAWGAALGAGALALRRLRARPCLDLADRVVVITGGSRGLGLLLAREFAAHGARLALLARDAAELERARAELADRGAEVVAIRCDVRVRGQVMDAFAQIGEALGAVDVLVNNAGIIQAGPFEHMSLSDFDESLQVHFWGPLYTTLEVLPRMRDRGEGRIVNIVSIGGKLGVPHLVPYCVGKFALAGLSESVQAELRHEGIHVTTVYPGLMRTGSHVQATFKGKHREEYRWFALSASLPVVTVGGARAARQIVAACRRGDPTLVLTAPARLGVAANGVAPALVAETLAQAARILPSPTGLEGDRLEPGIEARPGALPRWVTALSDAEAARNNELPVRSKP
jgi:NAD(P)-dependent dehydrogenase (short-subunit alcohol dehydrogenase family)